MNKIFSIAILLFSFLHSTGQSKSQSHWFTMEGQIKNYNKNHLLLYYEAENGVVSKDTIRLDAEKKFYFKTSKVHKPLEARFVDTKLFIAPGYHLTFNADGKDLITFYKSKKVSGIGSESNSYLFVLDSINAARRDISNFLLFKESEMLTYIKETVSLLDSITNITFNRKSKQDKYLNYFEKLVRLNNQFYKLYLLVTHVKEGKYDYGKSVEFVRSNFDTTILDNLYKDEFLQSSFYKDWLIGNTYLNYLLDLDYKRDPTLKKRSGYDLEKVDQVYKGKVREYTLFSRIESSISRNKTFKELNEYKLKNEGYISSISDSTYRDLLQKRFEERAGEIARTQTGKPAPQFSLRDEVGQIYSLKDFRGKVVYLDLWASWCTPCREETPYLKSIHEQYKGEKGLVIMSVSVDEELQQWEKALKEDRPKWLQLIDEDNLVLNSYVPDLIPKFIIIDKKGNIAHYDAPRPSEREKLQELLNQELAK